MNLLITGVSGHLGQAVVEHLLHQNPFRRIIGIDVRAPKLLGPVQYVEANLNTFDLADILVMNEITAVIHCASAPLTSEIDANAKLVHQIIDAVRNAEVERLVVPSRDWVYRSSDTPCHEDAPLRRPKTSSGVGARARRHIAARLGWLPIESKLRTEKVLLDYLEGEASFDIVIPRFCAIIGRGCDPRLEAVLSNRYLYVTPSSKNEFQILHIDDAARFLVECVTRSGLRGPYNIAAEDLLNLETIAGILEKPLVRMPTIILRWLVTGLSRLGMLDFGFGDLVRLQSGMPMSTTKMASALGTPKLSSRQSLALWRVQHQTQQTRQTKTKDD